MTAWFRRMSSVLCLSRSRRRELKKRDEENMHPLFNSTSSFAQPPGRIRRIFSKKAFVECLLKVALEHLSYHGTAEQSDRFSFCKALWLLLYLRWQFDRGAVRNGLVSSGSRRASVAADIEDGSASSSRRPSGAGLEASPVVADATHRKSLDGVGLTRRPTKISLLPDEIATISPKPSNVVAPVEALLGEARAKYVKPLLRLLKDRPELFEEGAAEMTPEDEDAASQGTGVETPASGTRRRRGGGGKLPYWGSKADALLQACLASAVPTGSGSDSLDRLILTTKPANSLDA